MAAQSSEPSGVFRGLIRAQLSPWVPSQHHDGWLPVTDPRTPCWLPVTDRTRRRRRNARIVCPALASLSAIRGATRPSRCVRRVPLAVGPTPPLVPCPQRSPHSFAQAQAAPRRCLLTGSRKRGRPSQASKRCSLCVQKRQKGCDHHQVKPGAAPFGDSYSKNAPLTFQSFPDAVPQDRPSKKIRNQMQGVKQEHQPFMHAVPSASAAAPISTTRSTTRTSARKRNEVSRTTPTSMGASLRSRAAPPPSWRKVETVKVSFTIDGETIGPKDATGAVKPRAVAKEQPEESGFYIKSKPDDDAEAPVVGLPGFSRNGRARNVAVSRCVHRSNAPTALAARSLATGTSLSQQAATCPSFRRRSSTQRVSQWQSLPSGSSNNRQ